VERRYGSFVLSRYEPALRYRYDEAEMMVQSLVPADTSAASGVACHHGPRRSSEGATARRTSSSSNRRGEMPRSGRGLLALFRSCSDVEAAAVDLEADISPGLDDDAVES
jgi:hypothetical protein